MSITVAGSTITMNSGAVIPDPSGTASLYPYRAWVNFDQTTSGIRSSGNVSSVGDLGVGLSSINFSTAMVDENYAVASCGEGATLNEAGSLQGPSTYSLAAASFNVSCASSTNSRTADWPTVSLLIIR